MRKSQHSPSYRRLIQTLRRFREHCGLTQQEVAGKLGTHASFISKCESGERRIDVVELATFCKLYDTDLVEFLRMAGLIDPDQ